MKKLIINILTILAIIGSVIFLQHRFFPTIVDESTHTSDTVWQDSTIIKYKTDTVWQPYYVEVFNIDTVTLPIDSASIAEAYLELYSDYNSKYYYNDTLQNDSIGLAILDYEISQNKPKYKKFTNFNRVASIINNTTNVYAQNEVFIGVNNTSPSILFKHKKGWIIGGGYDLVNKNERIQLHAYYNFNKIFKK